MSHAFKTFAEELGFNHRKITPLWPKANSEAERFMRTLGKAIRTGHVQKLDWQKELNKFLRNYRSTPHQTTHACPCELLMGRQIKTKLPELPPQHPTYNHISSKDLHAKQKMKEYADRRNRAKPHRFSIGDLVLPRQPKRNKFSTPFSAEPFRIIAIKGSMITAVRNGTTITRNVSHFKSIPSDIETTPNDVPEERQAEGKHGQSGRNREHSSTGSNIPSSNRYPVRQNRGKQPDYYIP